MKREQFCRVLILAGFFFTLMCIGGCNTLAGAGKDIQVAARAIGTSMAAEQGEDK